MGLRVGLDRCGKSRPPPGFDPRTVQPVASRYTDYATWPTLLEALVNFRVRLISSANVGSLAFRVDEHRLRLLENSLMTFRLQQALLNDDIVANEMGVALDGAGGGGVRERCGRVL